MSAAMVKFCTNGHVIQRLEVNQSLALKMFEDNHFKQEQIPNIASKSESGQSVTLYRVG